MVETTREATLVLGMHRSGTSLVAGLLVLGGLQPPKTLLPPDDANREGYWESAVLCALHERLLLAAGTQWDDYTRLDQDWLASAEAMTFRDECAGVLNDEFGDAPSIVVKDPRTCRFVPFWLQVLATSGFAASAVLVLRHPTEVAASLAARDGFSRRKSLLLWLRHVLEAEAATRATPRAFVQYDEALADWRGVMTRVSKELPASWATHWNADRVAADRFVRQDLRHHAGSDGLETIPPELASWAERAWSALSVVANAPHSADQTAFALLDDVRDEFDRAAAVFTGDAKARREARERIVILERELASRAATIEHLAAEAAALSAHAAALDRHTQNLDAERRALRSSLSWRVTAPLRGIARIFR